MSAATRITALRERRLRLVRAEPLPPGLLVQRPVRVLRLKGCIEQGSEPQVRPSAFLTLLEGLWGHEGLELLVSLDGHYRQEVLVEFRLMQSLAAGAGETRDVLQTALGAAFPRWRLDPVDVEQGMPLPPCRAVMRPANLMVCRKGPTGGMSPAPRPCALPSWTLTTPFVERLLEGRLVLVFRFASQSLNAAQRTTLEGHLHDLKFGVLQCKSEGAEKLPFDRDDELAGSAMNHWNALLSCGIGWRFEVSVHSDRDLSRFALRRIERDIFGECPVSVALDGDFAALEGYVAWPLLASQGLPGFVPEQACLLASGVASLPRQATRLPEGPGLGIGRDSAGSEVLLPLRTLCQHTLVVGGSGSGKSNLLRRVALKHIGMGGGLAYFDPHGPDVGELLASMPDDRTSDVVLIDLGLSDFSIALNPLEGTLGNPRLRNAVATRVADLINEHVEVRESRGPRVQQMTRDVLRLAMHHPEGGTLADAERITIDGGFRDWLLSRVVGDDRLKATWYTSMKATGEVGFDNWMAWLQARFEPFTRSLVMNATLNRSSTVDVGALMRQNAVVLIRMPQAALSDSDTRLLGGMLLMQFQTAAMCGAAVPSQRPYLLLVDEFAQFASPSSSTMFAQLRKFGVAMVAATQSVAALRKAGAGIAESVLSNTAAKVLFRLSAVEAFQLDEYTEPEYPARVMSLLPDRHAVLSLAAGEGGPSVRFLTALASSVGDKARADELRKASGRRHGTSIQEAIALIEARHPHLGSW